MSKPRICPELHLLDVELQDRDFKADFRIEAPNIQVVFRTVICDVYRNGFRQLTGTRAMAQAAISRILVGPYGLHAFGAVVLALFLAFLWVFNFTGFF